MNDHNYAFDVTTETFEQYVLGNSEHVPILVDFWAPWCGPCQSLMPMLSALAESYNGQFLLAKVNIDEQQELAMQYNVRSVPTVKLFRHGRIVDEFAGALPESQIRAFIDNHVEKESDRQIPQIMERYQAGETESALRQLRELRGLEPDNLRLIELELEILIATEQLIEADRLIQSLPVNLQQEGSISAIASGLRLKLASKDAPSIAELRQRLEQQADDSEARYQLAIQLGAEGEYEAALEAFIELLQRDPGYQDGAARKGMLMLFEQLGPEDERVARYRRRMFTVLH